MPFASGFTRVLAIALFASFSLSQTECETRDPKHAFFNARYETARAAYNAEPQSTKLAIHYAAAAFEWADYAENKADRAAIAEPAIAICREHLDSNHQQAEVRYFLALNLGQLARTRWIQALRIVSEMEEKLLSAKALEPSTHYAGIDRALSQLYAQAPKWPTSIGSRKKALKHAREALEIAPHYPGNQINFLEILIDQKRFGEAKESLPKAHQQMLSARSEFKSEYWAFSWIEWDQRLRHIKAKLKGHRE